MYVYIFCISIHIYIKHMSAYQCLKVLTTGKFYPFITESNSTLKKTLTALYYETNAMSRDEDRRGYTLS